MSVRHFNYTDRARIARNDVTLSIRRNEIGPVVDVTLSLTDYSFPADAVVYLEAIRDWRRRRIHLGTVGTLEIPDESERLLADYEPLEAIRYRILVVASEGESLGLLLGEADNLRADSPDSPKGEGTTLLPVEPVEDMGETVWQLDYEHGPTLQINARIADWKTLARSPQFVALVYPAIVEDVLRHILIDEKYGGGPDLTDWRDRWLHFGKVLGAGDAPEPGPEGEEDVDGLADWIREARDAFARKHSAVEALRSIWSVEEEG